MARDRITYEKESVALMIRFYCRRQHGGNELCEECRALLLYAKARLDRCPFGNGKTACSACKVHCYRPDMQARIRTVMRYAGPRMLWHHPLMALRHLWRELHSRPSGRAGNS